MNIDDIYQREVDREADALARLSPCELMQMQSLIKAVKADGIETELRIEIADFGDVRNIGIIAERKFGLLRKRYVAGITIQLSSLRMGNEQSESLYG